MHALESEPEKSGRLRRFGVGALVSGVFGATLFVTAQRVQPVAHALSVVVPIAVIEDPEPPKPKEQPPPRPRPRQAPAPVAPPDAPPPPPDAAEPPLEQVGLDPDSFGSGTGGPAFGMGTTQMGTPTPAHAPAPPPPPKRVPKFVEARPRSGEFMAFPDWARRRNIQGLMVIEAEIDERGRVLKAWVRGKIEPRLDAMVQQELMKTTFEPATLDGHAVRSTKYVRVRFELR
jgi:outer membrane biosynthesis protein TonB